MVAARREEKDFKERVEEGGRLEQMVKRKGGFVDRDEKDRGRGGKRKFRQVEVVKEERKGKKGKRNAIDSSVLNMLVRK